MKFSRIVTLDDSDLGIFEEISSAGEWAISGSFEFSNCKKIEIIGWKTQAFSSGWLGLSSFGRTTLIGVTNITSEEIEKIVQVLAQNFVKKYGAPSLKVAYPVAEEVVEFMKSICEDHPVNTLLMVSRELTPNGIREKFRLIKATDSELEAFAVHGSTE